MIKCSAMQSSCSGVSLSESISHGNALPSATPSSSSALPSTTPASLNPTPPTRRNEASSPATFAVIASTRRGSGPRDVAPVVTLFGANSCHGLALRRLDRLFAVNRQRHQKHSDSSQKPIFGLATTIFRVYLIGAAAPAVRSRAIMRARTSSASPAFGSIARYMRICSNAPATSPFCPSDIPST